MIRGGELPGAQASVRPAPWACKAAIRLCMNCWNAEATVVASGLEELPEDVPDAEALEEVLLLLEPLDCVELL
jgi:hypothetical protein